MTQKITQELSQRNLSFLKSMDKRSQKSFKKQNKSYYIIDKTNKTNLFNNTR